MTEDDSLLVTLTSRQKSIAMRDSVTPELTFNYSSQKNAIDDDDEKENSSCIAATATCLHYFTIVFLGLASWAVLWCAFGDEWSWNGRWFKPAVVVAIAWATGELLQMTTTLPPLLAALLTGMIARNIGYLDMRHYTEVDSFMRKIYPFIILGKGSLGWNLTYMKNNWKQVAALGVLPWTAEVVTLAICLNQLLGYPWIWGFLLGSIYASVSCPVLMPTVVKLTAGKNLGQNWPQLICTAGGMDTALSVGVSGVIHSFIMYEGDDAYRYIRAACALFVGAAVGVMWGSLAKFLPPSRDAYVTELRVLYVVIGGFCALFITSQFGWGGTGHFLIGRPLTSLPAPSGEIKNPKNRYTLIENLRQQFWTRWRQEYLAELQQRTKCRLHQQNLQIGDLVVFKEEGLPPLKWKMGRVQKVYPGSDGIVRVADFKTYRGTERRAVNKVCPLTNQEEEAE